MHRPPNGLKVKLFQAGSCLFPKLPTGAIEQILNDRLLFGINPKIHQALVTAFQHPFHTKPLNFLQMAQ